MSCDEKEREVGFIGSILSLGIVVTVYGKVERFILHEDKLFLKGWTYGERSGTWTNGLTIGC
ncbi:hypothetical protein D3C76_1510070 [compost metagenome]